MAYWASPGTEPKRSYRWLLQVGGIPAWVVKTAKKPSHKITETKHQYINHTFFYPGRVEWDPMDVSFVDPVEPDIAKTLLDIIIASGYHFPEDPDDTSTISKAAAVSALGAVTLVQLGPEAGSVVEEWSLVNAWMSEVNYGGDLKYDGEEMVVLTAKIRFDYAKMTRSGTPVAPANK